MLQDLVMLVREHQGSKSRFKATYFPLSLPSHLQGMSNDSGQHPKRVEELVKKETCSSV